MHPDITYSKIQPIRFTPMLWMPEKQAIINNKVKFAKYWAIRHSNVTRLETDRIIYREILVTLIKLFRSYQEMAQLRFNQRLNSELGE